MSLIHWWPLNGDTQDKITGKSGTLANGGVVSGAGKIGQCYSSNNNHNFTSATWSCADGIQVLNSSLVGEVGNEYSFACWFKVHGKHGQYQSCIMSSGNWNTGNCWVIGFDQNNTAIFCPVNNYNKGRINLSSALVNDQWYHLATVYNNGVSTAYLNGTKVGETSAQGIYQSSSTTAYIGRDEAHGGFFPYNGDINDLRIYDHALSQAEVKELSKALVIHYTFDDVCAKPTTNLLPTDQQTQSNSAATINVTSGLVNGATYTLSTYITRDPSCTSTNPRLTLRFFYSDGTNTAVSKYNDGGVSYPKDGVERYYFITATANSAKTLTAVGGWLMDHSSGSGKKMTATRSQLEISEYPTPYTPTSRESMLVNETGLNQPTASSNILLSSTAASGSYSLNSTGSTYIVHTPTGDGSNGATASMWIKASLSSNWVAFADSNSQLGFGCYSRYGVIASTSGTNKRRVTNLSSLWNTDDWNHVVVSMSADNTVNRCWINGVEGTYGATDHWTHKEKFTIGCRYNGSYSMNFTGLLDDFRFYHTELSSDDVQELYKSRAYITDKNSIETHQFIESKTQAQVTSKYCFEADEFYEELYSGYDVLEYIESTGTQYVSSGYVTTSTDYTYELDMAPTKIGGFYSYMGFMASGTTPRAGIHEYSNVFMLGANATTNSSTTPIVNERIVLKGHFKSGAQKLYKNGTLIASNSTTFNHSANTLPTYIFGRNYSDGRNLASMKLYSAKIYEGSTLVRHYIPARRQSDNALGLYDILTNTFCANSGSGTFVSGPAITNKSASIYKDKHVSGREIIEI